MKNLKRSDQFAHGYCCNEMGTVVTIGYNGNVAGNDRFDPRTQLALPMQNGLSQYWVCMHPRSAIVTMAE
jgi:hypothetical protein